jgi:hypothetical protein
MADQPYTEADVERVAEALKASNVKRWETGKPVPAWCDLATAALDALAAAGRLLPEGARRSGELFGTGFIHTDRATGQQHVLNPADITVVLHPDGRRTHGICGEHAPTLFGANLDLQVCELTAGHKGWHGHPNGPGEPWMNWTEDMIVSGSTDE